MTTTDTKFADPDYVREYVASVAKPAWVDCREGHHEYRPYKVLEAEESTEANRVVIRIRKCRRCTTKRSDTLLVKDGRASIQGTKYEHPEGYLMERGHGRLGTEGRDVIRDAVLHNEMIHLAKKSR